MSEVLEIEFKNLVSEAEFEQLLKKFTLSADQFFSQTNYYFDTADFQLKNAHVALRIRNKNGKTEMTLKQPTLNQIGLLETNQSLPVEEAETMIQTGKIPEGPILDKIKQMQLSQELLCFGHMKTERAEVNFQNGLLVFDKSSYLDYVDFEIEYEVQDYESGKKIFEQFLHSENILLKQTPNKIKRFYTRAKALNLLT